MKSSVKSNPEKLKFTVYFCLLQSAININYRQIKSTQLQTTIKQWKFYHLIAKQRHEQKCYQSDVQQSASIYWKLKCASAGKCEFNTMLGKDSNPDITSYFSKVSKNYHSREAKI